MLHLSGAIPDTGYCRRLTKNVSSTRASLVSILCGPPRPNSAPKIFAVAADTRTRFGCPAASTRAEIGARTLRPRIARRLDELLVPLAATALIARGGAAEAGGIELGGLDGLLRGMQIDRAVPPVSRLFSGRASQARRRLGDLDLHLVIVPLRDRLRAVEQREETRDLLRLGGLGARNPKLAGALMLGALAALGLPGLAGFTGEILILTGIFKAGFTWPAIVTLVAIVLASAYMLRLYQGIMNGPEVPDLPERRDMTWAEGLAIAPLVVAFVVLGVHPGPLLSTLHPAAETTRVVGSR